MLELILSLEQNYTPQNKIQHETPILRDNLNKKIPKTI